MFGHDRDNSRQDDAQIVTADEPVADDTLGSNDDSHTSGINLPTPSDDGNHNDAPPVLPSQDEDLLPAHASGNDGLLDIKQQALQQLSPLVGHLDQTPEEKFKTTMMMIQAADDQSLIKTAYDAAQQIPDEKAKAQALLDIVNEINYFTQQQKSN